MRRAFICTLALASLLLLVACSASLPSDDSMIHAFQAQQSQYVEVLGMFQADSMLVRIDPVVGDIPENPSAFGVDAGRLRRYRALMHELGVLSIERLDSRRVLFTMSTSGLAGTGGMKGFVFTDQPPAPLVDDTDRAIVDSGAPDIEVYRRIEGGWYLVNEWSN